MEHLRQRRRVLRSVRVCVLAGIAALIALALGGTSHASQADPSPGDLPAPPTNAPTHYVGVVEDSEIFVAVLDHGNGYITLYLCDAVEVAVWFTPESADEAESGQFALTAANGSTATGTIADDVATGTAILASGAELNFTATLARLPAGLYTRGGIEDGETLLARTIVLPDGRSKGKAIAMDCDEQLEAHFDALLDWDRAKPGREKDYLLAVLWDTIWVGQAEGCSWAF